MVTTERRAEVAELLAIATRWAKRRRDVTALALLGSWARGAERMDSDIDLLVMTDDVPAYAENEAWISELGGESVIRRQQWGPWVTERRLLTTSGLEIEVDLTERQWAWTDPVEPGTRRAVVDGMRILHDPAGNLTELQRVCRVGGE